MKQAFLDFVAENMTIDDIPSEGMRMIAENCGIEVALKIMQNLAGARFSVPRNWQKVVAERYIMANASKPVNALAVDVGLSDTMVLRTLNKKATEIGKPVQRTVFDYLDDED